MTIIPAIDVKDGYCVRLRQGRPEDYRIYSEDPVKMAEHWVAEGAQYLHVVDLDGAFEGRPVHRQAIVEIAETVTAPVQVGGGLRTNEDIRYLLGHGVDRAIIGTWVVKEPEALKNLVNEFGSRLAVGIDARDGMVRVKGWSETTDVKAVDLASAVDAAGVSTLIYTDIAKDGMLIGVNVGAVEEICEAVSCSVIASGGVTSVEDIKALRQLRQTNLVGAIVGKALYEGKITLEELSAISDE